MRPVVGSITVPMHTLTWTVSRKRFSWIFKIGLHQIRTWLIGAVADRDGDGYSNWIYIVLEI